ncbi:MAG: flagellar biosynthetic protein FliR [Hyphomonadaceae bacterium]|nr:flagellar biosynthetic protein FliR [Hyphomonadaceae bacterium]
MVELFYLSGDLTGWAALFVTVVARLSFIIFFMPGIGEQVIPMRVRLAVLFAISTLLASHGIVTAPAFTPLSGFFQVLAGEVAIGFFFGVSLRLMIWMLSIAGTVIAQAIGLSQILGVAADTEAQAMTANMLSMAGAAVLLSANFHIVVVAAMVRIYTEVPLGALASVNREMLVGGFFDAFNFALLLAWPFVAINLLYNLCLGFINKALPQLMVAFVGAPFMVGAGAALFALTISGLLFVWKERIFQLVGWL